MDFPSGVSLEVPEFFTADETADAIAALEAALDAPVADSGARRSLSSSEVLQPIQIAIHIVGNLGLNILGCASWAAIVRVYAYFRGRYGDRPVSIELVARDGKGDPVEYSLGAGSDSALRAIPDDLARNVNGPRVEYDVDEGWLTWEEASTKRHQKH